MSNKGLAIIIGINALVCFYFGYILGAIICSVLALVIWTQSKKGTRKKEIKISEKEKLNSITIAARIVVVFFSLMVISIIFAASKEMFPTGGIGFGIRVLVVPGLFYIMYHGTKIIKIGK